MKVVIGKGLATTTFVVEVADGAVNKVPECAVAQGDLLPHPDGSSALGRSLDVASDGEQPLLPRHRRPGFEPPPPRGGTIADAAEPGRRADAAAERLRFEKAVAPILDSLDASHVTFN